jgi:amino acid efflux transporter
VAVAARWRDQPPGERAGDRRAAARLFGGIRGVMAIVTVAALRATTPFAGWHLLIPAAIAVIVIGIHRLRR